MHRLYDGQGKEKGSTERLSSERSSIRIGTSRNRGDIISRSRIHSFHSTIVCIVEATTTQSFSDGGLLSWSGILLGSLFNFTDRRRLGFINLAWKWMNFELMNILALNRDLTGGRRILTGRFFGRLFGKRLLEVLKMNTMNKLTIQMKSYFGEGVFLFEANGAILAGWRTAGWRIAATRN